MNTRSVPVLAALGCAALCATGCASFYNLVDPGSQELKVEMSWESELPDIDPVDGERRIVYLDYKDASGSDLPNLKQDIRESLEECGYKVTRNIKESWFLVNVKVRYFGEKRDENSVGTAYGAMAGGVVGAGAGYAIGGNSKGTVVGGGSAAAVGALAGNLADKHNPLITYNLVLEVSCGERVLGGFKEWEVSNIGSSGTASSYNSVEGKSKSTWSSNTTQKATDRVDEHDFSKKKNVLTISVTKRNLESEEAYGAAAARLTKALGGIMPDTDPDIDPITPAEYLERQKEGDSEE
jgi:hypothetical protein